MTREELKLEVRAIDELIAYKKQKGKSTRALVRKRQEICGELLNTKGAETMDAAYEHGTDLIDAAYAADKELCKASKALRNLYRDGCDLTTLERHSEKLSVIFDALRSLQADLGIGIGNAGDNLTPRDPDIDDEHQLAS